MLDLEGRHYSLLKGHIDPTLSSRSSYFIVLTKRNLIKAVQKESDTTIKIMLSNLFGGMSIVTVWEQMFQIG